MSECGKKRKIESTQDIPIAILQLPDTLTKKSAVLNPPPRFFLQNLQYNPTTFFAKCVLASDTHLDTTRTALRERYHDSEFEHLQTKIKGGEIRMFSQLDRTVEFPHLQISITGYQWFDSESSSWKRVKGNRFSTRYLIFSFYEGQQYSAHLVHPIAVYSHPSQREPLRSILGYGIPSGSGIIPIVEDVIPDAGPAYSHNTTCVTGSGFEAPAFVMFGEQTGIIDTQKSTWIKCRTPNSVPGVVSVTVVCAGRTSNDDIMYTFFPPPHYVPVDISVADKSAIIEHGNIPIKDNPYDVEPFYSMAVEQQLEYMSGQENYVYCSGMRAIHYGASFGKASIVQSLTKKGQNLDIQDLSGATPLFWAVWGGHVNTVKTILDLGCNANIATQNGETPLHIACLNGNIAIVELLLKFFANIEARTVTGETPLFFASGMGCLDIVKLLVGVGGNLYSENKYGETPMQWAILGEQHDTRLFLEKEALYAVTKRAFEEECFRRVYVVKCIKQGYVFKKRAKLGTWKKRFLVLEAHTLAYYKKDNKKEKKGEIITSDIFKITPINYKERKFVFKIQTFERSHFFLCNDENDRQGWIDSIYQHVQNEQIQVWNDIKEEEDFVSDTECISNLNIQEEDLEQVGVISKSSFGGQVLLVRKKDTSDIYAMKVLDIAAITEKNKVRNAQIEQCVLSILDHPFLAKLQCSYQTDDKLVFITEFFNGGSLAHNLERDGAFSLERVRFYSAQILLGLEYLHDIGIIYRNLMPENVLLSAKGNIIMTNFEFSKLEAPSSPNILTFDGKTHKEYLAPEFIKGDEYTKAIDYWSIGILIYEMMTGVLPFSYQEDNKQVMFDKVMNEPLDLPDWMDKEICNLLKDLLQKDPLQRLTDPIKIKEHPFFKTIDWVKLEELQIDPPYTPIVWGPEDIQNFRSNCVDDDFGDFTYVASDYTSCDDMIFPFENVVLPALPPIPDTPPLIKGLQKLEIEDHSTDDITNDTYISPSSSSYIIPPTPYTTPIHSPTTSNSVTPTKTTPRFALPQPTEQNLPRRKRLRASSAPKDPLYGCLTLGSIDTVAQKNVTCSKIPPMRSPTKNRATCTRSITGPPNFISRVRFHRTVTPTPPMEEEKQILQLDDNVRHLNVQQRSQTQHSRPKGHSKGLRRTATDGLYRKEEIKTENSEFRDRPKLHPRSPTMERVIDWMPGRLRLKKPTSKENMLSKTPSTTAVVVGKVVT